MHDEFLSFVLAMLTGALPLLPMPIQRALSILPPDIRAAVKHVEVVQPKSKWAKPNVLGWNVAGQPTVFIAAWSGTYRNAAKGNREALLLLAATIAHEQWHIENGPSEEGAYDESVRVLRLLRAPNRLIKKMMATERDVLARPLEAENHGSCVVFGFRLTAVSCHEPRF